MARGHPFVVTSWKEVSLWHVPSTVCDLPLTSAHPGPFLSLFITYLSLTSYYLHFPSQIPFSFLLFIYI